MPIMVEFGKILPTTHLGGTPEEKLLIRAKHGIRVSQAWLIFLSYLLHKQRGRLSL